MKAIKKKKKKRNRKYPDPRQ